MTDRDALIARLRAIAARFDMTSTERYEQDSEAFYAQTGYMAPGKDVPMAMGGQDESERRAAYEAWVTGRNRHQQQAIREAADALSTPPPADLVALLKDTADALWGMQMQPDCWCPPGISAGDYHTDACRDARAVSKRLLAYPPPAPDRSDRNDTRRDCTCLGSCRGPEGLGERWKCALGKSPAPDRSDR